jgi:hypothetical protein
MNYKDLEVWQIARELSIEIHKMTLSLPKFNMYKEGSQIRRSSKSIRSNIVKVIEGADIKMSLYHILYLQSHQQLKQLIILKFCGKQNH